MKNCPKGCGMFQDYETKCPNCGARLIKTASNTTSKQSNAANSQSGTQAGPGNQTRFAYDTHIYGLQPTSFNNTQAARQNGTTGNIVPVQQGYGISGIQNQIRGRVKNFREDFLPMSQLGNILYSAMHGPHVTRGEEVTVFQLIEYDQNDNQTGRVYSVTLRGKVVAGHFYEGNTVIVEGKKGRGGEIYAKNIFNESADCVVRYRRNKRVF